jgi:hypothetical protein
LVIDMADDWRAIRAEADANLEREMRSGYVPRAPGEDVFDVRARDRGPPERPRPARGLDTMPIDWNSIINERVATERRNMAKVIGEEFGEAFADLRNVFERQLDNLHAEMLRLLGEQRQAAELRMREMEVLVEKAECAAWRAETAWMDEQMRAPAPKPAPAPKQIEPPGWDDEQPPNVKWGRAH